jgi:hypothetical protein
MALFPDAKPRYVTAEGTTTTPATGNGGLFGGCGFLGLLPPAPNYVGINQPVDCPKGFTLFGVAEPKYEQPSPAQVSRMLASETADKAKK